MGRLSSPVKKNAMQRMCKVATLLLVPFLVPCLGFAQAAAETAGATSASAGMSAGVKAPAVPATPNTPAAAPSAPPKDSPYITLREGPPPEDINRKTLEEHAGKDAAKLLLRSSPSGARIYVNELFVGPSPLLLIVPPGKYRVQMRGERQELGERVVGLLPNDTQNITIVLAPRYPARISIR
jgi:PEGA domain